MHTSAKTKDLTSSTQHLTVFYPPCFISCHELSLKVSISTKYEVLLPYQYLSFPVLILKPRQFKNFYLFLLWINFVFPRCTCFSDIAVLFGLHLHVNGKYAEEDCRLIPTVQFFIVKTRQVIFPESIHSQLICMSLLRRNFPSDKFSTRIATS